MSNEKRSSVRLVGAALGLLSALAGGTALAELKVTGAHLRFWQGDDFRQLLGLPLLLQQVFQLLLRAPHGERSQNRLVLRRGPCHGSRGHAAKTVAEVLHRNHARLWNLGVLLERPLGWRLYRERGNRQ